MIELTAGDGHTFSAYRADPPDAPKGAVVVLQEVFGVNPHIRQITDAFAARGYVAIAPSLFDSIKPGVELGYDDAGVAEGIALMQQVGKERAFAEIQAAVDAVKSAGKVAIVGYCWGGYLAYAAGNHVNGLACAVGYYGGGIVASAYSPIPAPRTASTATSATAIRKRPRKRRWSEPRSGFRNMSRGRLRSR